MNDAASAPTPSSSQSATSVVENGIDTALYDRQLRLWGEYGQLRLQQANVCLIGATATGTELLKNMILPGVGSFTIIDGATTTEADLGVNFFVSDDYLGRPRAETCMELLRELNDSVRGKAICEDIAALIDGADDRKLQEVFGHFTVVIVADWAVTNKQLQKLGAFLWDRDIPLVIARVSGLFGSIRLVLREHCVIEARADNAPEDLRINCVWPELQAYADSIDLDNLNAQDHSHTPYLILLVKMVAKWRAEHGGRLPHTSAEKDAFKAMIKASGDIFTEENFGEALKAAVRAYMPYEFRDEIKAVFADPKCNLDTVDARTSDFWILSIAAKLFAEEHEGKLPLPGSIPDMTAFTHSYLAIQRIYADRAAYELSAYAAIVDRVLAKAGRSAGALPADLLKLYVRNVNVVRTLHSRSLADEIGPNSTNPDQYPIQFMVEEYSNVRVHWALRACAEFQERHGHFPGSGEDESKESDVLALTAILDEIADSWGVNESLEEGESAKYAEEMWRYGGAELHPIASFIGGVVAQEAIKVISKQFTPFDNTFVFNGCSGTSMVLQA